jgi:hypothetical protein
MIDKKFNWDAFKTEIGIGDKNTEEDRFNLGYTMFKYLKEEYPIKHGFSPCRYYEQEKYDLIQKLRAKCKTSIEKWIHGLKLDTDITPGVHEHFKILQRQTIYGKVYICLKEVQRDIGISYDTFMKMNPKLATFGIDAIMNTLIEKGFKRTKSGGTHWLRMLEEDYNRMMTIMACEDDVEDMEFNEFSEETQLRLIEIDEIIQDLQEEKRILIEEEENRWKSDPKVE